MRSGSRRDRPGFSPSVPTATRPGGPADRPAITHLGGSRLRLYLDASAFVKLLLAEPGADEVRSLWREADELVTASVTLVEARSAIARRLRGPARERARRNLAERWQEVVTVQVDEGLLGLAVVSADEHRLRALDAIHLAAGRVSAGGKLLFATWDEELRRAARASGLAVAPA